MVRYWFCRFYSSHTNSLLRGSQRSSDWACVWFKPFRSFPISFPESTCLLVSTKTRSSGIINKLVPRALASFAFKIWYCCPFKATFLVLPGRIECLWGTYPHRLYKPCKPSHACAVKPEVLKSCSLGNWLFQSSVSWCCQKGTWALGTRLASALIGQKTMFSQSIKDLKKRVLLFCTCKICIIKQMKKSKPCITRW